MAALLLAAYAVMAFAASWRLGQSFDEGQQLAVGYNLWLNDDFRIEGANGDFIKRWATLPYLISRPRFPGRDDPSWRQAAPYELGYSFFFRMGNRPESLLRQGRAMVVVLGVATGLLVFLCSRRLFGDVGGLISLGLFAFSPHMLAFGAIVSTDMSVTLWLFASTCCIWRLLHVITWRGGLASLVVLGFLLLAKLSALVILPVTAALIIAKLAAGRPLHIRWAARAWTVRHRRLQAAIFAGLVGLHALVGWGAIWMHYGFRFTASPDPSDPGIAMRTLTRRDEVPGPLAAVIAWSRETRFFPEGFRRGVHALLTTDDHLGSFLNGSWKLGGQPTFFPYAIWAKSSPALLLLAAVGAGSWLWMWRRPSAAAAAPRLLDLTPHLVLVAVYLAIALTEDINLGHRHILPIYPSLYVILGRAALAGRTRFGRIAIAASLAWTAHDTLAVHPDYLAYFGPQAGGPSQGYTHLVDSSLDWGMNLPALKQWLDTHNPGGKDPVFLAYFGTDNPDHYGIKAHRLPGFFDWRPPREPPWPSPGYYAISASLLQGVYTAAFGPWSHESERVYRTATRNIEILRNTKPGSAERLELLARTSPKFWTDEFYVFENLRFARLCAWLRHRGPPSHQVGHAIMIWKLSAADLSAALLGPPVELTEAPLFLRRF